MENEIKENIISIEHTKPGKNLPNWLIKHQLKLAKWIDSEDSTFPRILVIYANEESRKQALKELNAIENIPIDSSLHLTIPRLIDNLHSDLRLPTIINDDGILFEIIHNNCVNVAGNAGFPRLHSNLKITWSRGKTRMLDQLHRQVCERNLPFEWDADPGVIEYEKVLSKVEKQMSGTHPRLRLKKIIKILKENKDLELFSLREIDGIIIQDMSPTLSEAKLELLQIISKYKPIHQFCNPGSFRLGEHGAFLADVEVCKTKQSIPKWIPEHEFDTEKLDPEIFHLGLFNSSQTDEAIHGILSSYIANFDSNNEIIIVDPRPKENREKWPRLFESIGIKINSDEKQELFLSVLHCLGELMKLGFGQDAWSSDKLKMISNQNNYTFKNDYLFTHKHPENEDYFPVPDSKLLEETARNFHILGGSGSLNDWLYALSREKFDNPFVDEKTQRKLREQTQWWVLSIANLIRPLLNKLDREALDVDEYKIGCDSKKELPILEPVNTGDAWLFEIVQKLDWNSWLDVNVPDFSVVGIQKFLHLHNNLRNIQKTCGLKHPIDGVNWIEEAMELINSISMSKIKCSDNSVRILSPENALGCNADLVIVVGLGNDDWDLSMPYFPWLDFEELREAGLLNPDEKIRAARHYFNHILFSGKQIILLDPSIDSKTFPCTPFAEWLIQENNDSKQIPDWLIDSENAWSQQLIKNREIFVFTPEKIIWKDNHSFTSFTGSTLRSNKQKAGVIRTLERKNIQLLNDSSPLIIHEKQMYEDRIKREPRGFKEESDYLEWDERVNFVSTEKLKLIPPKKYPKDAKTPREYPTWPVIGRQHSVTKSTPSIDPRPLEPKPLGIELLDQRSGHSEKISISKKIIWSASKLNKWAQCPRRGWLESELYLSKEEIMNEDLDIRVRGITLHESFAELICSQLGFEVGKERHDFTLMNILDESFNLDNLMAKFVKILSQKAPWIWRADAMSVHRRRDFIGMTLSEFENWIDNEMPPLRPKGRIGQMLLSELKLEDSINVAFEWNLSENNPTSIYLPEISSDKLLLRGWIDRIDLVPFENGTLINEEGDNTPAPFSLKNWTPRRLIIIRDTKSVEGPSENKLGEKHKKAIFEDFQLALYARAWELAHPGDLVIGVGITEVGDITTNSLEIDPDFKDYLSSLKIGELTEFTHNMYRFPDENLPANSNPFRAWIYWKLVVALKTSNFAKNGKVHPTPGKHCEYCSVRRICGVGLEKRGDF